MSREEARRGRPGRGLPNRDAVKKTTRRKRRQTRFGQHKQEYPLSFGGQAAAAAAVSPRLQPWGWGNARRDAVSREEARRGRPGLGLPNRDAVEKATRLKRRQTRFIQQKREYPLSFGGQVAAAAALAHGFSRGKRAPESRAPRVCVARETMPGFTQSGCREKDHTAKKKANEVHSTETRIPPLLWRSSSGSRSFSPRLQPWETRAGMPCPASMRGAGNHAWVYPIGMPGKGHTAKKESKRGSANRNENTPSLLAVK